MRELCGIFLKQTRIKRAVDLFNWESVLIDLDVNEQVPLFNDKITNIMSSFVPNKIIICDDRDPSWVKTPPWCQMINILGDFQSDTGYILAASWMWYLHIWGCFFSNYFQVLYILA